MSAKQTAPPQSWKKLTGPSSVELTFTAAILGIAARVMVVVVACRLLGVTS